MPLRRHALACRGPVIDSTGLLELQTPPRHLLLTSAFRVIDRQAELNHHDISCRVPSKPENTTDSFSNAITADLMRVLQVIDDSFSKHDFPLALERVNSGLSHRFRQLRNRRVLELVDE